MTTFIYHNLIFLEILTSSDTTGLSSGTFGTLLILLPMQGPFSSFQKAVVVLQSPALGSDPTCLVLISSLSFHLRVTPTSQLLSWAWFLIIPNVMAEKHHSLIFFWFYQFIIYLLTLVCWRVILDLTASWTTYFLLPNLPLHPLSFPNSVFFFFSLIATNTCILSQQYLLHPPLHYHFNQVPSIHTLMKSFSSPVILSRWLFSYIPLHLFIS